MKNVVIYPRVSTGDQVHGYSLRDQEDKLRRHCERNGLIIHKHFEDSQSGKNFNRKEFQKIIEYVKSNPIIDGLLVVKWDRFSRAEIDESITMIKKFRKLGVEVQAIEQPLNWNDPNHKWMLSIYLTGANVENDQISNRVKVCMRRAMLEGRWMGSAPFGYRNSRDEKMKPIIVPNENAETVRSIFRDFTSGQTDVFALFKKYSALAYNGSRSNLYNLLTNPVYIGKIRIKSGDRTPETMVDGIHEAIISDDMFEKAQAIISGRHVKKTRNLNTNVPLKGHILCSKCGKPMTCGTANGNGGKYWYYRCNPCREIVSVEKADRLLQEHMACYRLQPEVAEIYLTVAQDVFEQKEKSEQTEAMRLDKEIQKTEARISSLDMKFIDDAVDKATYGSLKKQLKAEIDVLKGQRHDMTSVKGKEFLKYLAGACTLLTDLDQRYKQAPSEIKSQILGCIFPEKLHFQKNSYATTKLNPILASILSKNNTLENKKIATTDGDLVGWTRLDSNQ
ncbi:recombinase family protein [bacterium]|nr:MAG: recombinase family protein [bacterium]